MTTTPPTEFEFPVSFIGVREWENCLLARYRSRDLESSPMDRSRMDALKVTNIRRFKEKKNAEHEYIVAEVYDPDLGRNRYLRIERYVDDEFPHTRDDTSLHSIPTTSSPQSSLVLKKFSAADYVRAIAEWPTSDTCIDKLKCQDSQMIVLDLAMVAKVVHDHSAEYQALTHQCFWYSAVIVSVLRRSFPQIKVSNSDSSLKAEKKGGTYRNILIYSEQPELITEIYGVFETYKDLIYSSITEAARYVEQKADADRKTQKEMKEAQKAIEVMQKENERVQKEKEDAERRANEAQKEIAALKQCIKVIEAKATSGG